MEQNFPLVFSTDFISELLKNQKELELAILRLSLQFPMFTTLVKVSNGEISSEEIDEMARENKLPIYDFDCYDLVSIYRGCKRRLIKAGLLDSESSEEFMAFGEDEGQILFGQRRTTTDLEIFVYREEYLPIIQRYIDKKLEKIEHHNATLGELFDYENPSIEISLAGEFMYMEDDTPIYQLHDHWTKFYADLFNNIPFLVYTRTV